MANYGGAPRGQKIERMKEPGRLKVEGIGGEVGNLGPSLDKVAAALSGVAGDLGNWADAAAKVEGNADERGSAEYNLALGQKRAEAVVKGLKIYGATDRQLEAVSWGEERPVATGHDEAAWAKNRRADIVYPKQ